MYIYIYIHVGEGWGAAEGVQGDGSADRDGAQGGDVAAGIGGGIARV